MTETGEQKSNKIGGSRSLWKKSFAVNLLIKVHLAIHLSDTDDVRPTLQHYSQFGNPMAEFRRRAQELASEDVTNYYWPFSVIMRLKIYKSKFLGPGERAQRGRQVHGPTKTLLGDFVWLSTTFIRLKYFKHWFVIHLDFIC